MKKVAVLFSGGLDSTYLIYKNLKDGNEVYPIYVEIENNEIKSILEKNRVELLYNKFSKEFNPPDTIYKKMIYDVQYPIKVGVNITTREDSLHFKQVPIWVFSLLFIQNIGVDEIQIGYVCGDDAIPYLKDIEKIYKSYQTITDPLKPLKFPITKMKKDMMVHDLPQEYLDLIVSCENPRIKGSEDAEIIDYEPCGRCAPCKTIIASDYYGLRNYPEIYKESLIRLYSEQLRRFDYTVYDKNGENVDGIFSKMEVRIEPYQLELDFYRNEYECEEIGCGIMAKEEN